jgi:hypothetical protein
MLFTNEEAKAIEESAKAAGKGIDLLSQIGKDVSGPVKEVIGIIQDTIAYKRWLNQMKIAKKIENKLKEIGKGYKVKPIDFKFAVKFLEEATLEEDDYIQDLWANLLINVSMEDSDINLEKRYIDTLKDLSPFEAKILYKIYEIDQPERSSGKKIATFELPERVFLKEPGEKYHIDDKVILALANLSKLDCIMPSKNWGMEDEYDYISQTLFGKYFIKSCTLNFKEV